MTRHKADVVILGAGPAGCITARHLGLAGLDVILIDAGADTKSHQIESFPASGAPLLDDIGLLALVCEVSDGPAAAMRLNWRDVPELRVFEGDGPLLLRREDLHNALRAEAGRHVRVLPTRSRKVSDNGQVAEVTTDAGTISCRMVVDARGRSAVKRPAMDLVALPFTARGAVAEHTMWLDALPNAWLWAVSLAGDEVHGALFQKAATLSGSTTQSRFGYARQQLSGASPFADAALVSVGPPVAAGLSYVSDPVVSPRHVLVGDAALARDPIASHGLVHAIRSAVQVAIALRTILDPKADSSAAYAFLRHKHTDAIAAAQQATARAYGDQTRVSGPFWSVVEAPDEPAKVPDLGGGPLTFAAPLTRAPLLDSERIRWAPAIELPARRDVFIRQGSLTALDVAVACRPPAPLQDIAARLGRVHPARLVLTVLDHLIAGGAFVQAPLARPSKARARFTSHASSKDTIPDSAS